MKKYTFIGRKTSYADSVVIFANNETEAETLLEQRIDADEIEFEESTDQCDYHFEIESVENVYTPLSNVQAPTPNLNVYTPMSSLQQSEQLSDFDGDLNDDDDDDESWLQQRLQQYGYVPMSAVKQPEPQEESSSFFGAATLATLVEKLANQVYKLEQKLSSRNKD